MFISLVRATLRGFLFAIFGSCFVAELADYWLHHLMHCDRLPVLNRLLRTISRRHRPFNCNGYRIAQLRYSLNRDFEEDSACLPSGFRIRDGSQNEKREEAPIKFTRILGRTTMRFPKIVHALTFGLLLSGCTAVTSLQPPYAGKDLVTEPNFAGTWDSDKGECSDDPIKGLQVEALANSKS